MRFSGALWLLSPRSAWWHSFVDRWSSSNDCNLYVVINSRASAISCNDGLCLLVLVNQLQKKWRSFSPVCIVLIRFFQSGLERKNKRGRDLLEDKLWYVTCSLFFSIKSTTVSWIRLIRRWKLLSDYIFESCFYFIRRILLNDSFSLNIIAKEYWMIFVSIACLLNRSLRAVLSVCMCQKIIYIRWITLELSVRTVWLITFKPFLIKNTEVDIIEKNELWLYFNVWESENEFSKSYIRHFV